MGWAGVGGGAGFENGGRDGNIDDNKTVDIAIDSPESRLRAEVVPVFVAVFLTELWTKLCFLGQKWSYEKIESWNTIRRAGRL